MLGQHVNKGTSCTYIATSRPFFIIVELLSECGYMQKRGAWRQKTDMAAEVENERISAVQ